MERSLKTRTVTAALQIGALFLLASGALAAPPQGRMQPRIQAPAAQRLDLHLDLRAPSHAMEAANLAGKSPSAFPMVRRQNPAQERIELPLLGSDGMRARPTIQEFVHKVHQEGLPIARLFETKSALVHLGLSPRGKPGLWLVQKTH